MSNNLFIVYGYGLMAAVDSSVALAGSRSRDDGKLADGCSSSGNSTSGGGNGGCVDDGEKVK